MTNDPNRVTTITKAKANVYLTQSLNDIGGGLSDAFQRVEGGLKLVRPPSIEEARNDLGLMFGVLGSLGKFKGQINYMIGDYLNLAASQLGADEVEEIVDQMADEREIKESTISVMRHVCNAFPPEKRLEKYTAMQELYPLVKVLEPEDLEKEIEWARAGEATLVDGQVKERDCRTCGEIRERVCVLVEEKTGKPRRGPGKPTVTDPTGDAERLRLSEAVCSAVQEMIMASGDQDALNQVFNGLVFPAFRAWEQYTNKKKGRS